MHLIVSHGCEEVSSNVADAFIVKDAGLVEPVD